MDEDHSSIWGHTAELALEAAESAKETGAEVSIFQVCHIFI